jgi:hypothetical protein
MPGLNAYAVDFRLWDIATHRCDATILRLSNARRTRAVSRTFSLIDAVTGHYCLQRGTTLPFCESQRHD